ncbi:hypothetical protein HDV04_001233 [Boothiomyces sp. JEL0838]|nr:hypothetical protein HDV04_001233 [Boothiomyces sp. JEL0838]
MPTVNVDVVTLYAQIGREFTDKEFEDLCFDFGIELEDVTSSHELSGKEEGENRKIYRIDIPANRYDMLCVEGIARAIRTYLEIERPPVYKVTKPAKMHQLHVGKETAQIRPYVVAAILRNVEFDQLRYDGFIELQDKLHNNICRKRTLVAIGTHDLDTITGPFYYEAQPPQDINFIPLNQTKKMNGHELMEFYQSDRKLSKFLHIIKDSPVYPVVYDGEKRVLSLPPIINGDHSKISKDSKNIFIECTATDLNKAKVVLNTIVAMYSTYAKDKFTVEPVEVVYPDGKKYVYPDVAPRQMSAKVDYINSCIGIKATPEELAKYVSRMSLDAKVSADKSEIICDIPITRSDILHACDIMEDAAVAYNFNKITETHPATNTIAQPFPINKLTDMLRREIANAGYTEGLAFTLCSHDENFKFLNKIDNHEAVTLANPRTAEFQVVRTSLLPGILKTISANKHLPLPLKLFEIQDIVLRDETVERRARNQRNFSAIYCNKTSGFERIHGLVDRLMQILNVKQVPTGKLGGYYIKESTNPTFFEGRRADLYYQGNVVGSFGVVHPEVLGHFEIAFACSALEINIEPFL